MRITKISVKNLFGLFNHEIPLNIEEHITIIHGPNGYGKTILLTLIDALFNSRYHEIRRIPFSEIVIDFDDKSSITLKKNGKSHKNGKKESVDSDFIKIEYSSGQSETKVFSIGELNYEEFGLPISIMEDVIPGLERVEHDKFFYLPKQEVLSVEDVLLRFGHLLPKRFSTRIKGEPKWFEKIKEAIRINFVKTQRLLTGTDSKKRIRFGREEYPSMIPAVNKYAEELAEAIQSKLSENASLSQSLDRTFPTRLIKGISEHPLTIEKLREELDKLENKRARLIAAGFLKRAEEIDSIDFQKIDQSKINVLSVYVHDVKKKLGVFDSLTEKIDLMVQIINSHFLFKELSINQTEGFIFKTPEGKDLPLSGLSSGEQHELVMLYEMLFKVKPGSLILIDEPELSLHVVWQQKFLEDLTGITKLVGFDVLIATHSPQIINDRWDLTVELKAPGQS